MNPRQRIEQVEANKALVLAHCMCARFEETPSHFVVTYPPGFRFGACSVAKGMGQAKALEVLLSRMELHWKDEL